MTAKEILKIATQTLTDNPKKDQVFVCEDGLVYFTERSANEHNARFVHKKVHGFTRSQLSEAEAAEEAAKKKAAEEGKKGK